MHRLVLGIAMFLGAAGGAQAFEASFTWAGIPACSSTSPAFRVKGAPAGTTQLRFSMTDYHAPNFRHGGSTIAWSKGDVPKGAISYIGPCPPPGAPHRYIWTIDALDSKGATLGQTRAEGLFPPK